MTYLAQRLADLRRYLDHVEHLRGKITGPAMLERDLSVHNDVLFSLLMICQMVIDICGELSARAGLAFGDYTEAVTNLRKLGGFPEEVVQPLSRLPGFRNVIVHEYVTMNYERVVEALRETEPIKAFVRLVAQREQEAGQQ
ncbi:MAG TPA: DUF86 domain-containing protein [bacterium]|nr:DUF86 domain-containing protein [bacterium]